MINLIKTWGLYLGSGCLSLTIYLMGGYDILIKTLLVMMIIDFITGIMKGYKNKNINSNVSYRGIKKKVTVLLIVVGASQMDLILHDVGIRSLVLMFYVATEFLSILENAAILGIPIPTKLKVALEQYRNR